MREQAAKGRSVNAPPWTYRNLAEERPPPCRGLARCRTPPPAPPPAGHNEPFRLQLRQLLHAYVVYRPDLGYVQGMSYVAGMLVLYTPDTFCAFQCLTNLMVTPPFLGAGGVVARGPGHRSSRESSGALLSRDVRECSRILRGVSCGVFAAFHAMIMRRSTRCSCGIPVRASDRSAG